MQTIHVSPEKMHRYLLLSGSAFMIGSGRDMRRICNAMATMLFDRAFAELGEDWHERTDRVLRSHDYEGYKSQRVGCEHKGYCNNFKFRDCKPNKCRAYQPSTQQKPPHVMESYEQDSLNRTLNREMDIESGRWESGSACRIQLVPDVLPVFSETDKLHAHAMGVRLD